jgi:hypothetical protein
MLKERDAMDYDAIAKKIADNLFASAFNREWDYKKVFDILRSGEVVPVPQPDFGDGRVCEPFLPDPAPEPSAQDVRELADCDDIQFAQLVGTVFGRSSPEGGYDPTAVRVAEMIVARHGPARRARAPSQRFRAWVEKWAAEDIPEGSRTASFTRVLAELNESEARAPSQSGAGAILEGLRIDLNSLAIGGMTPVWYESKARALLERLDALLSSPSSGCFEAEYCEHCGRTVYQRSSKPSSAGEEER